jgi:hypothetical protein
MCAMPGAGVVLPVTSGAWCEPLDKIIRRKLMPSLEHVTWREPTVTPTRLAMSSRLIPAATDSLICSITCGVNLMRLPLAGWLAFVIVMAAPLVAQPVQRISDFPRPPIPPASPTDRPAPGRVSFSPGARPAKLPSVIGGRWDPAPSQATSNNLKLIIERTRIAIFWITTALF